MAGSATTTATTRDDIVVAFVDVQSSIVKDPLDNGDQVRFVRDGPHSFDLIHAVHGKVYSDYYKKFSKQPLPRFIDQGHIVLLKETATVVTNLTGYRKRVHFWLEIGIRKECVEMVSRSMFRGGYMRLYLRITPGSGELEWGYEKEFLGQVYEKWKTSRQFLMEISKGVAGVGLSPPVNVIKLELYEHQKQGLRWMIDREEWPDNDDTELPPFWEERDGLYRACMSSFLTLKRPEMVRGGILADESGMGKTLTLLSLIAYTKQHSLTCCANKSKSKAITTSMKKKRKVFDHDENGNFEWRPTLVVCPPSVLATWNGQIEKCTWPGSLKVCTYRGKSKTKDPNLLRQHDLVLTTYNIVVREEESGAGILNKINWWRVVLDDVHVLKGITSRSVTTPFINLKANRRWAVTGKPFQEVHENYHLHPSMAFLQVHPYCDNSDLEMFQCSGSLTRRVEVLMGIFSLRRTMPPRFIQNHMVVLSKDEQDLYDSMEAEAKKSYGPRSLHAAVLHLWQSCNSLALCRLSCAETKKRKSFQDLSHKPELLKKWVNVLQEEKDYCCPVCLDQPEETVITRCTHLFCKSCIMHLLKKHKDRKSVCLCPMCRSSLNKHDIFCPQRESFVEEKMKTLMKEGSSSANMSSKVSALLTMLQKSTTVCPNKKSVVFSQFRSMLMHVEGVLSEAGFDVRRMDAIDNTKTKAKTVKEFSNAESSRAVLLTTFKALTNTPGLDLDLSAASNVCLMEPCWNAYTEEEALSSIRRLGRKEDVNFIRLVCKNSIEEKVLEMRENKPADGSSIYSRREIMDEEFMKRLLDLEYYGRFR